MSTVPALTSTIYPVQQQETFTSDLFLKFVDYIDRQPSTIKGYITCIKHFAVWLSNNDIQQPARADIKTYKEYLDKSTLAIGTQHQYLRAVKQFFKWTAAEGLYPNIADNIHTPTVRHDIHKKDALQREDVAKIAATIDRESVQGKRLYAMYLLCITCGLRCIELHRANIEDIKKTGDRTYLYVWGKGKTEPDTPVLLIPEVQAAIEDYLQTREKTTNKSPLFIGTSNRSKGRIATTTISTMLKTLLKDAGYNSDRLTAHSLRHTSGTGAYKATGNLLLAQKHQRHANPETTEIYIHAEERAERDTEQQVYNYYFSDNKENDKTALAMDLINQLTPDQLNKVIDYINLIKK